MSLTDADNLASSPPGEKEKYVENKRNTHQFSAKEVIPRGPQACHTLLESSNSQDSNKQCSKIGFKPSKWSSNFSNNINTNKSKEGRRARASSNAFPGKDQTQTFGRE